MAETSISDMASLGSLVRDRRRALDLRQADLAMLANVGVRFIVDVENGKETCQAGLLLRLLATLDIKLTAFVPSFPVQTLEAADEMKGLDL